MLWSTDVVEHIGYYDSVRFGGDTEFRQRLLRAYGPQTIVKIPDELYFLRKAPSGLTSSRGGGSAAYIELNGSLKSALSPERKAYAKNMEEWENLVEPGSVKGCPLLNIEFPLMKRPFELGSAGQNASPSIDQRRVAAMASFPPRRDALKAAISSIIDQIDELILYLNDYFEIPEFVLHPKIRVIRSQDSLGDLRDNGKFFDLPQDDHSYVFTIDDDIVYPKDYVARMIHHIEMLDRKSIVGLHGVIFPNDEFESLSERTVYHFAREAKGYFVDLIGTGTSAWHSSTLKVKLSEFETKGYCDLWFAALAAKNEVPIFSVPRNANWLNEYQVFEQSLWNETSATQQTYFDIYNRSVAPVLKNGLTRRRMNAHLVRGYRTEVLAAAGINIEYTGTQAENLLIDNTISFDRNKKEGGPDAATMSRDLRFHIVVNIKNCHAEVDAFLHSIARQRPGQYTYDVTLIDNGSDDGSYEKLVSSSILPNARLVRNSIKSDPADVRKFGVVIVNDPDAIIILVELRGALKLSILHDFANQFKNDANGFLSKKPADDVEKNSSNKGFNRIIELGPQHLSAYSVS